MYVRTISWFLDFCLESFVQCIGEGGLGGLLRIDFSSDGEWIRAEAHGKAQSLAAAPIVTILVSASSGEVCEGGTVRRCHLPATSTHP